MAAPSVRHSPNRCPLASQKLQPPRQLPHAGPRVPGPPEDEASTREDIGVVIGRLHVPERALSLKTLWVPVSACVALPDPLPLPTFPQGRALSFASKTCSNHL